MKVHSHLEVSVLYYIGSLRTVCVTSFKTLMPFLDKLTTSFSKIKTLTQQVMHVHNFSFSMGPILLLPFIGHILKFCSTYLVSSLFRTSLLFQ